MKHPVESDFDTSVTEAGVTITFKPTSSIYSFYRLADTDTLRALALSHQHAFGAPLAKIRAIISSRVPPQQLELQSIGFFADQMAWQLLTQSAAPCLEPHRGRNLPCLR